MAAQAKRIADLTAERDNYKRLSEFHLGIAKDAKQYAEKARADARTAAATSDQLRRRVAELVAARRSAPSSGGSSAGDPLDLFADLFSRLDRRAGELAEYADDARGAGLACERSYDTLTTTQRGS